MKYLNGTSKPIGINDNQQGMDRTNAILNNARKSGYAFDYRITVLGDKATGKTSLLNRYLSSTFTHRYRPTIGEHATHIVEHNGSICVCLFIDTCGGNDFPAMRRIEISKGNAFFVVYAINDRKTFETTKSILAEIRSLKGDMEDLKIILIGTKTDLEDEREVQYNEGRALVNQLNERDITSRFFEVGSKEDNNVAIVFESLLDMYIPKELVIEESNSSPRKYSTKKADNRKHKRREFELTRNVPSFSDSDLRSSDTSKSVAKHSLCNSPKPTSRFKKSIPKENSKHFIQKTIVSIQRILSIGHSNTGIFRSNTYDSSMTCKHVTP